MVVVVIRFNHEPHGHAIAQAAGIHFNSTVDIVISREDNGGELLGGVIYQDFTGASITIHMAGFKSGNWADRDMLWVAFDYPFNQLKVHKILGYLPSNNLKALDIDKKLGFSEVVRIPGVYPGADLVILAMERCECRWLNIKPRSLVGNSNG